MRAFKKLFQRSSKSIKQARPLSTTATPKSNATTTPASTMAKQTIVVFGATGKQGGSVVKTLLNDPKTAAKFHVKAVTRDVTKDSAKALTALGAEVVSVCQPPRLSPVAY